MATKKEIKETLKELNLTEGEMDNFWNDLLETNALVKQLHRYGKTWRDMNSSVIKTIPTQKQKDIESNKIKEEKERVQKEAELKEKQDKDYYNKHFKEIMVGKIDNKEDLTERELSRLTDFAIEEIEGSQNRWTRDIESIVEICDRTFSIHWQRGLTESQENDFYNQPYEVEKKETIKTITVTEWVKK